MNQDIDFVITYVNGNDQNWLNKKNGFLDKSSDNLENHYRDWNNLKYWFRGVEKYTPWVHKIYFITDNQLPSWLNTDNEKLVIINHDSFLDKEDLPTFNSNAIELKMHKITGLSEQFVYFNDDMFITNYIKKEEFFKNGLPRDSYGETLFVGDSNNDTFPHFILNDMEIINKYFNKKDAYKSFTKYYNFLYFNDSIKSLSFRKFKKISSIQNPHIALSLLKSTFNEVWNKEEKVLNNTCSSKFRTRDNVNIFLFRYWQLLSGKFIPRSINFGHYYGIKNNNDKLINDILNHKYKVICINDDNLDIDFNKVKKDINNSLEYILNSKSSFER